LITSSCPVFRLRAVTRHPAFVRSFAHLLTRAQREALLPGQRGDILARHLAPVAIRAQRRAGGGQLHARLAPFHHHGHPLRDLFGIGGEFHAGKQRACFQRLITLAQIVDILIAPHQVHMRGGIDEGTRIGQNARLELIAQELARDLEHLVDLDRLDDLDLTLGIGGCIVQLAQRRMARARIVPSVRAFIGDLIQPLDHLDRPFRLQFAQENAQRGAHDPSADQQHVHLALGRGGRARQGSIEAPPTASADPIRPRRVTPVC
jgi:hypothetical protein